MKHRLKNGIHQLEMSQAEMLIEPVVRGKIVWDITSKNPDEKEYYYFCSTHLFRFT